MKGHTLIVKNRFKKKKKQKTKKKQILRSEIKK